MAIILFDDKNDCCSCGACMNVCPKNAITMKEDEYGFTYPHVDEALCIECGACKRVCGYGKGAEKQKAHSVYAAAATDEKILRDSASGGAFAVLARNVLKGGGVVYGAALQRKDDILTPKHIRIDRLEELKKLQGSKYVQSEIGYTYRETKEDLQQGRQVLFSGTPCKIEGLKMYLKSEDENLLTVEVICHGVPSKRLFQDFIKDYGNKLGGCVKEFYFRDKSKGQGKVTRCIWRNEGGIEKEKINVCNPLAYIHFFSESYICRVNCYSCPYASPERVADITLGDFWGFHEEYPKLGKDIPLSNGKGISCILVNNEKGEKAIQNNRAEFILLTSEFEKVSRHNEQLCRPSRHSERREVILELYKKQGYQAINQYYRKHCKKERLKYFVSGVMPKGFKRFIKKAAARIR